MTDALFPKPPKRMKQPKKDVLREQLALSADAQIEAKRMACELADSIAKMEPRLYVSRSYWRKRATRVFVWGYVLGVLFGFVAWGNY